MPESAQHTASTPSTAPAGTGAQPLKGLRVLDLPRLRSATFAA